MSWHQPYQAPVYVPPPVPMVQASPVYVNPGPVVGVVHVDSTDVYRGPTASAGVIAGPGGGRGCRQLTPLLSVCD